MDETNVLIWAASLPNRTWL